MKKLTFIVGRYKCHVHCQKFSSLGTELCQKAQVLVFYNLGFWICRSQTLRMLCVAGFYTAWLLPAAVVGFFVFLYGVFAMWSYIPA